MDEMKRIHVKTVSFQMMCNRFFRERTRDTESNNESLIHE